MEKILTVDIDKSDEVINFDEVSKKKHSNSILLVFVGAFAV